MSIFSKHFKKNITGTSKKSAYFIRENRIQSLTDIKKILNPLPDIEEINTNTGISFNGMELSKIAITLLKKEIGDPSYVLDNSDRIDKHKILFYKDSADYYKFLIQYHFINDQFFFASNKISSLGILSPGDKNKIIGQIRFKYLGIPPEEHIKTLIIKIGDRLNNVITTVDDVYFHINYLAENTTTQQLAKKHVGRMEPAKNHSGFKETLDKYI